MRRSTRAALLSCASIAFGAQSDRSEPQTHAVDRVVIWDHYRACEVPWVETTRTLERRSDRYMGDGLDVPATSIELARKLALGAAETVPDVLGQFGVMSAEIERQASSFVQAFYGPDASSRTEVRTRLATLWISARLEAWSLEAGLWSTSSHETRVDLPGDPPIRLAHTSYYATPFFVPWTIEAGGKGWSTPDVRITRALEPLLMPGKSFDSIAADWRAELWSEKRIQDLALSLQWPFSRLQSVEGFEQLAAEWKIDEADRATRDDVLAETLVLTLHAKTERMLDGFRWWLPHDAGTRAEPWSEVAQLLRRAEEAVRARSWLLEWKRAGERRSIELRTFGASGSATRAPRFMVLPAWQGAELPGSPEFELVLMRGGEQRATVYLSETGKHGLIVDSTGSGGAHWIDTLSVHFHPNAIEFAFFDERGERHLVR